MLQYNLSPVFKARGIRKPYSFLVKAGISHHSAYSILSGQSRSLRLDHIELICSILTCEPNDLLVYTPDSNHPLPVTHPLNNLIQNDTADDLQSTLANIPYKELKDIKKQIDKDIVEEKEV